MMRPSIVVILLCVISAASAYASPRVYRISLERVVHMSQLIVVAERELTDSPEVSRTLKITEILHARRASDDFKPGQTIKVYPIGASTDTEEARTSKRRTRYLRNFSDRASKDTPEPRSIYFLSRCHPKEQRDWCLTVSGATESLKRLQEIRALIPKR